LAVMPAKAGIQKIFAEDFGVPLARK
jgi:hypothetical protein